jgi:hypothetical protein
MTAGYVKLTSKFIREWMEVKPCFCIFWNIPYLSYLIPKNETYPTSGILMPSEHSLLLLGILCTSKDQLLCCFSFTTRDDGIV